MPRRFITPSPAIVAAPKPRNTVFAALMKRATTSGAAGAHRDPSRSRQHQRRDLVERLRELSD
ncbi:MAG TPA: hypothetical protein VFS42_06400 [Burkholderiaceae bacterium]|nr:hypothetical protein [Burkholderiaceae bacterium]